MTYPIDENGGGGRTTTNAGTFVDLNALNVWGAGNLDSLFNSETAVTVSTVGSSVYEWTGENTPSSYPSGGSWTLRQSSGGTDFSGLSDNSIPAFNAAKLPVDSGLFSDTENLVTQKTILTPRIQFSEASERIVGWYSTSTPLLKGSLVLIAAPANGSSSDIDSAILATFGHVVSQIDFAVFVVAEDVAPAPDFNNPSAARVLWTGGVNGVNLGASTGVIGNDVYITIGSGGVLGVSLNGAEAVGIAGFLRSGPTGNSYNIHFDIVRAASTLAFNIAPSVRFNSSNQFATSTTEKNILDTDDKFLIETGSANNKAYVDASVFEMLNGALVNRNNPPRIQGSNLLEIIDTTYTPSQTTPLLRRREIPTVPAMVIPSTGLPEGFISLKLGSTSEGNNFLNIDSLYLGDIHSGNDVENGTPIMCNSPDDRRGIVLVSQTVESPNVYNIYVLVPLVFAQLTTDVYITVETLQPLIITDSWNVSRSGGVSINNLDVIPRAPYGAVVKSIAAKVRSGNITYRLLKNGSTMRPGLPDLIANSTTNGYSLFADNNDAIVSLGDEISIDILTEPNTAQDLYVVIEYERAL